MFPTMYSVTDAGAPTADGPNLIRGILIGTVIVAPFWAAIGGSLWWLHR